MLRNIKSKVLELLLTSILDFVKARDDLETAQKEQNYYRQVLIKANRNRSLRTISFSSAHTINHITAHYSFNYVQ